MRQYIRKTKRRKAAGPDEIPIEFFKEMLDNDSSIQQLTAALNKWWNEEEELPDEMLQARVVLIFKQGSTKDIIVQYQEPVLKACINLIKSGISLIKENCVTCIAATSEIARETFIPYLEMIVPVLLELLKTHTQNQYKQLCG